MKIPIFVITAHGNKDLVINLMRKGCAEYLDKPFDDEEFVKRVGLLFDEASG
jgi:FixJ family two-component response regulator